MPKVTAEQAGEQITLLYQEWTKAVGNVKDYSFLERHLDDQWWYVDYHGVQRSKAEYRKLVETIVWYTQDMQRLKARMASDDIAIVAGVYRSAAELITGEKLANTIIFSATWEIQGGVWKALMHHTTKLPDAR